MPWTPSFGVTAATAHAIRTSDKAARSARLALVRARAKLRRHSEGVSRAGTRARAPTRALCAAGARGSAEGHRAEENARKVKARGRRKKGMAPTALIL